MSQAKSINAVEWETPQVQAVKLSPPDPEVPDKAQRRRFSAKYKLKILQQADECTQPGELGALLRREGLYSSYLGKWRLQRDEGVFGALTPKKRGRKAAKKDPLEAENARLRRENEKLQQRLAKAELIIDVQKKYHRCWPVLRRQPTPARTIDGCRRNSGP